MAQQSKVPQEAVGVSHGRGGAGNIGIKPDEPKSSADLKTPTIKQQTYTTGRGGSGNMASNDSPDSARMAQDVEAPAHFQREIKGTHHWGRGGEGNKMTVDKNGDKNEREKSKGRRTSSNNNGERRPSVVEKGKELLGLKHKEKNGSAIEDD